MMPVAIYGWKCLRKDKAVLLKRLNEYLARHRQQITETATQKIFDGYLPFVIKHFYWNLYEEMGTWFDVYPNEDLKGNQFFPEHNDCAWLIHMRIDLHRHANIIPEETETFVRELLTSTMFEFRVIKESGDLLEGLQRGHINEPALHAETARNGGF
jgi:hypothetical protein